MINFAKVQMLNTNEIKFLDGNRDVAEPHKEKMKSLIEDFGFADTIKVAKSEGVYYALEGQHRLVALRDLGVKKIPCSIVDWVDSEDFDEIQTFIINMNAHNRAWVLFDYVKSFADKGIREYVTLKRAMIDYSKTLSNGVVATIYDGITRSHKSLKQGNLRFVNEALSDRMIEEFSNMVLKYGKKKLPAQHLRSAAHLIIKSGDPYQFLRAYKLTVGNHLTATNEPLPDGDDSVTYWFENTVQDMYETIMSINN